MKKLCFLISMFLCLGLWAEFSGPLNSEFTKISVGGKEFGAVYTKVLGKKDSKEQEENLDNLYTIAYIHSDLKGEGMMALDDYNFEELEDAFNNHKEPPTLDGSVYSRWVELDNKKFLECITLAKYECTNFISIVQYFSSTPSRKILIGAHLPGSARLIATEAPQYLCKSTATLINKEEFFPGFDDKYPCWRSDADMIEFATKLTKGTCECKTSQKAYNKLQEVLKTIKIE